MTVKRVDNQLSVVLDSVPTVNAVLDAVIVLRMNGAGMRDLAGASGRVKMRQAKSAMNMVTARQASVSVEDVPPPVENWGNVLSR